LARESSIGVLSALSAPSQGVFRGAAAVDLGVSRKRLTALIAADVIERVLPDTYRITAVSRSAGQKLRAALLWAGPEAAAAGRSAAVVVHQSDDRAALRVRPHRGLRVTGVEATLVALAATLDGEAFEIACEDARRRRLTSVPALRTYLDRHGAGRAGVAPLRQLLGELDPVHPARSTLEVKTRRLLVAHGLTDFVRELPLEWRGRTYRFDFAFDSARTILETNRRRGHDDATDYEHDNEKWSVPGRHGFRLVLATWDKVTRQPGQLLHELRATLAA